MLVKTVPYRTGSDPAPLKGGPDLILISLFRTKGGHESRYLHHDPDANQHDDNPHPGKQFPITGHVVNTTVTSGLFVQRRNRHTITRATVQREHRKGNDANTHHV